jgi:hypothetical protein
MEDAQKRMVIVVQPDGSFLAFPCPPAVARNISVIANTALVTGQKKPVAIAGEKTFAAAGQAIPFFGLLIGLAYIGHKVRVFDGSHAPLTLGCKDADVLIVDSGKLPDDWQAVASAAMHNANIFVHDRETYKLRIVQKVGEVADRINYQ